MAMAGCGPAGRGAAFAPDGGPRAAIGTALLAALLAALAGAAAAQEPRLGLPIACQIGTDCFIQNYVDRDSGPGALDHACGPQTYDGHNGTDFRLIDRRAMRAGVDVLAAAAGRVLRLRDGVPDAPLDPGAPRPRGLECGNGIIVDHGGGWTTQYCHLAAGSVRVRPEQQVRGGEPIGKVGLSGWTVFPHVHLTVRRGGVVVDPFAPSRREACGPAEPTLWNPDLAAALAYRGAALLNAGLSAGPVDGKALEAGAEVAPFDRDAPALVLYARVIHVRAGDRHRFLLTGPAGAVLLERDSAPADKALAVATAYHGVRRPANGWAAGRYGGRYALIRDGQEVVSAERSAEIASGR